MYTHYIKYETLFQFRYVIPLQLICGCGFIWGELLLALEAYLVREWFSLQVSERAIIVKNN